MNILEEEIQNEIKHEEYKNKIKKNCAWCNEQIPGTIDYYYWHGNACLVCCARFSKIEHGVRQKEKKFSKRRSRYEHKIRKYTREEVEAMQNARIKEIKLKQLKKPICPTISPPPKMP